MVVFQCDYDLWDARVFAVRGAVDITMAISGLEPKNLITTDPLQRNNDIGAQDM